MLKNLKVLRVRFHALLCASLPFPPSALSSLPACHFLFSLEETHRGRQGVCCRTTLQASRESQAGSPCPPHLSVWPSALCLERPPPLIFSGDCAHPSVSNSNKSISCGQSRSVAFSVPTDVAWAAVESTHLERGGLLHGAWA